MTTFGLRINNLNKFIKIKRDITEPFRKNHVVYKINCKICDATYVSQSKRLQTRIKEHINNIKLDSSKHSVISEHTQ